MTKQKVNIRDMIVKAHKRKAYEMLDGRKPSAIEKDLERKEDKYRHKLQEFIPEDAEDAAPFFPWEDEDAGEEDPSGAV